MRPFLVVWEHLVCIAVTEYATAKAARDAANAINEEGLRLGNGKHATVYHGSSRECIEDDPACCVGGRLDAKSRDLMDFCSDFAEDGWDC
ncbi:MAG: hypothetical protein HY074_03020 [Deltaproteobacteria bacterium]|nr:hypothetical protein [Deltaproteobacteria bacterium]